MKLPHECPECGRAALILFQSVECCNCHCSHYSVSTAQTPPDAGWDEENPTKPGVSFTGAPVCCNVPMSPFSSSHTALDWHCWTCGKVA
jgi:hypothetical protein